MSRKLADDAEAIRKEIKSMIPRISEGDRGTSATGKAAVLSATKSDVTFGGKILQQKVSDLIRQMGIAEVGDFRSGFLKLAYLKHRAVCGQ